MFSKKAAQPWWEMGTTGSIPIIGSICSRHLCSISILKLPISTLPDYVSCVCFLLLAHFYGRIILYNIDSLLYDSLTVIDNYSPCAQNVTTQNVTNAKNVTAYLGLGLFRDVPKTLRCTQNVTVFQNTNRNVLGAGTVLRNDRFL